MKFNEYNANIAADACGDQLPLISRVGRGIKGDSARVRLKTSTADETILEGGYYDEATKTFVPEWVSQNLSGGELTYQCNMNPDSNPRTFTLTLDYKHPGHNEWSWTSPAIPYVVLDEPIETQEG